MPIFRHQVFIARPIEAVFAAVANVQTHPRWQAGLLRTTADDPGVAGVGARGAEVRRLFGREVRFPYEITHYEPSHVWGFRALEGPVRPAAVLTFSTQNDGTHIESVLTIPGLLGFLAGRVLLAQQQRNYMRLKELLETGEL